MLMHELMMSAAYLFFSFFLLQPKVKFAPKVLPKKMPKIIPKR
jgi:hypothetical protein